MDVTIRTATQNELPLAHAIHQSSQVNPWSFATFSDCATPPYQCIVVLQGAEVIGYAILLTVADEGTLMDIAVANEYRGYGVGKKLLTEAIQYFKDSKMAEVWLEVRASNQVAVSLYEITGFEHIEVRKNYYPTATGKEDAFIMRCVL